MGRRIVQIPKDPFRTNIRDPKSGFIAYVPPGNPPRRRDLVKTGAAITVPCASCHGDALTGMTTCRASRDCSPFTSHGSSSACRTAPCRHELRCHEARGRETVGDDVIAISAYLDRSRRASIAYDRLSSSFAEGMGHAKTQVDVFRGRYRSGSSDSECTSAGRRGRAAACATAGTRPRARCRDRSSEDRASDLRGKWLQDHRHGGGLRGSAGGHSSGDGAPERTQAVGLSKTSTTIKYRVPSGEIADRVKTDTALDAEIKAIRRSAPRGAAPCRSKSATKSSAPSPYRVRPAARRTKSAPRPRSTK